MLQFRKWRKAPPKADNLFPNKPSTPYRAPWLAAFRSLESRSLRPHFCSSVPFFIFFIASVVFGGTAKFKQVWIVACWAYVIALLGILVKTPLILAKNSVEAGLNFGLIFSADMVGPKLNKFFNVIDIFGIWHFIIAGIGLAVLYKFSTKKGIGIAFIIWLLMTAVGGITAYLA